MWEPGRIGGGRGSGDGRGKDGKWKFWKGGKWKKSRERTQQSLIFRNRKRVKGSKPKEKGAGAEMQDTGDGRFGSPLPPNCSKISRHLLLKNVGYKSYTKGPQMEVRLFCNCPFKHIAKTSLNPFTPRLEWWWHLLGGTNFWVCG